MAPPTEKDKGPERSPTPSERGSDTMRIARRKACDLCFNKKIKCDMLKPVCSNCRLYNAQCKTTMIRRKSAAPKDPPASASSTRPSGSPNRDEASEALESRLSRIESQLQQVLLDAASIDRSGTVSSASTSRHQSSRSPPSHQNLGFGPGCIPQTWTISPTQQGVYEQLPQDALSLPPLEDIAPVIDHFFLDFNAHTPLFDRDRFMIMLADYYNDASARNVATWAAIQIALAIGCRTPAVDGMAPDIESSHRALAHLGSAHSVISQLVTWENDMLGVQVLLGIVIVYMQNSDYKPAAVIVANACRLAYQLGLNEIESPKHGPPSEAQERHRTFWVAYCLDRGLALRIKAPPTSKDEDIDLALPDAQPQDGLGLIWIPGGNSYLNHFRLEVELAQIQGKIFELLHSNRGAKVRGSERAQRVQHLQVLLDRWYNSIPPLFHIENLVSTLSPSGAMLMTRIFHDYQLAVLNLHSVCNTHDQEWIQQLSNATPVDGGDFSMLFQQRLATCRHNYPTPTLEQWQQCVSVSRACMKLFQSAYPTETIMRNCICAMHCGLVTLLGNIIMYPSHPLVTLDQYICNKAMSLFERIAQITGDGEPQGVKLATMELSRKANAAADAARLGASTVRGPNEAGGAAQRQIVPAYQESMVQSNFDMSMMPNQSSSFDLTLHTGGFAYDTHGFNPEDMEDLGLSATASLEHVPDYTRYPGSE